MDIFEIILAQPVLTGSLLIWTSFWLFSYFTCGVCKSKARMDGKTVIITGCNSGIGKETAFDIARRGARVIMACRNMEKASLVRDIIIETTKNKNVVVRLLDLSRLSSVRKFAEETNRTERRLDVLIHNAASGEAEDSNVTKEGLQVVWATNHLGPFLLTHLLIDLLKKTGNGRIILVSSCLHLFGCVKPNNPNPVSDSGLQAYMNTKFANVIFANELARRLEGSGVTSNSLHPGIILTQLWDNRYVWVDVLKYLLRPFCKNEEQGAQTTIHLAVSEKVKGVSGKYFVDCREHSVKKSLDVELAKKFWEASEEVVQLKPSDPRL